MMSRLFNIESYQCGGTCGKKFNSRGCFELHLRTHSVDALGPRDEYLATWRLRTALGELQKVISSSSENSRVGRVTGLERGKADRIATWPTCESTANTQGVSGSQGQQSASKDNNEATNIIGISDSGNSKGEGGSQNKESKTHLLKIKHTAQKLQNIQSHRCNICGTEFGEQSCFELHIRKHLSENPPSPDLYSSMLKLRGALIKLQTNKSHCKEDLECEKECSLQESGADSVEWESNPASSARSLWWQVCQYCGECFDSEDGLSVHKEEHTGTVVGAYSKEPSDRCRIGNLHGCSKCFKKFVSLRILKRHMHDHSVPSVCDICGKMYDVDKLHLFKRHMNVHTRDRPYKCNVCGKGFLHNSDLQLHIPVHSNKRPFLCSVCGERFKSQSNLRRHNRVRHTGRKEERHLCDICGKSYTRILTLQEHYRSHTGEKPFSCRYCGKSFASARHIRVHEATHEEPRYKCLICQKGITTKFGLRCHMRQHTGEEPYSCDVCNKSFKRKHDLVLHMKKKHLHG